MTRAVLDDLMPRFCSCKKAYAEGGVPRWKITKRNAEKGKRTHFWQLWTSRVARRQRAHDHDMNWGDPCRNIAKHFSKTTRIGTTACNGVEPLRAAIRELQQNLKQCLELHNPVPGSGGTATVQGDRPGQKRPPSCSLLRPAFAMVCQAIEPQQLPGETSRRARTTIEHDTSSCIAT